MVSSLRQRSELVSIVIGGLLNLKNCLSNSNVIYPVTIILSSHDAIKRIVIFLNYFCCTVFAKGSVEIEKKAKLKDYMNN